MLSPSSSSGASSSGGGGRARAADARARALAGGPHLASAARWAVSLLTLRFADAKLERRFQRWRNSRLARVRPPPGRRGPAARDSTTAGGGRHSLYGGAEELPPWPPASAAVLTRACGCAPPPAARPQVDATALLCLLLYHAASCFLPPFATCLPWPGTGLLPALTAAAPLLLLLLDRSHAWYAQHRCARVPAGLGPAARRSAGCRLPGSAADASALIMRCFARLPAWTPCRRCITRPPGPLAHPPRQAGTSCWPAPTSFWPATTRWT